MKVILVRHGQSVGNLKKISQGWKDWGLSELGIEQAKKVGAILEKEKIDRIYSSDLGRAKMTAEEIEKIIKRELKLDKRLREQCKGVHEGMDYDKVNEKRDKLETNKFKFTPEGGETWEEVNKRVDEFFEEIISEKSDRTILLVAHGGTFRSLLCSLFDELIEESDKYKHGNTGVTYLELINDEWKIIKFNCMEHLE